MLREEGWVFWVWKGSGLRLQETRLELCFGTLRFGDCFGAELPFAAAAEESLNDSTVLVYYLAAVAATLHPSAKDKE